MKKEVVEKSKSKKNDILQIIVIFAAAILILMIVLASMDCFDCVPQPSPVNSISNTLSTYANGGSGSSTSFTLKNGDIISSSDLRNRVFDQHSIILATAPELEELFTITGGAKGDEISKIQYIGSTRFYAKAQVYCQVTGELLATTLENYDPIYIGAELPGICEESLYQPCCLVVIKRA